MIDCLPLYGVVAILVVVLAIYVGHLAIAKFNFKDSNKSLEEYKHFLWFLGLLLAIFSILATLRIGCPRNDPQQNSLTAAVAALHKKIDAFITRRASPQQDVPTVPMPVPASVPAPPPITSTPPAQHVSYFTDPAYPKYLYRNPGALGDPVALLPKSTKVAVRSPPTAVPGADGAASVWYFVEQVEGEHCQPDAVNPKHQCNKWTVAEKSARPIAGWIAASHLQIIKR